MIGTGTNFVRYFRPTDGFLVKQNSSFTKKNSHKLAKVSAL
ncbi:MAG: hypothetical protein ACI8Y9_000907 [Paracoccaceae bacterium]|jgi:hypothetical protein